eukprot:COSAG06_NODE_27335_length_595_cov_1.102823_1_plen_34_part_10
MGGAGWRAATGGGRALGPPKSWGAMCNTLCNSFV